MYENRWKCHIKKAMVVHSVNAFKSISDLHLSRVYNCWGCPNMTLYLCWCRLTYFWQKELTYLWERHPSLPLLPLVYDSILFLFLLICIRSRALFSSHIVSNNCRGRNVILHLSTWIGHLIWSANLIKMKRWKILIHKNCPNDSCITWMLCAACTL